MQTPPLYSAIRVNGKRAYSYAREGKSVELEPRPIEIYAIEDINVDMPNREVTFVVTCSKGTYVRSLVNDIGKKIGCGAIMTELCRIKTGDFDIEDSIKLYDFLKLDYEDMLKSIVSIEEYYKEAKKVILDRKDYNKFLNGVMLDVNVGDGIVRVYCDNRYRGLGVISKLKLKRYIIE